jgi:hypothetical protein
MWAIHPLFLVEHMLGLQFPFLPMLSRSFLAVKQFFSSHGEQVREP